jgi:hypothetical protein
MELTGIEEVGNMKGSTEAMVTSVSYFLGLLCPSLQILSASV